MSEKGSALKVELPGVDFAEMARLAIAERLTEAMVGSDAMITSIVATALSAKVDENGVHQKQDYYNRKPFIEWMAEDLIRKATMRVLQAKVESLAPAIEKAVEAELKRSTKAAAKALTASFVERAKNSYGITCDIGLKLTTRE